MSVREVVTILLPEDFTYTQLLALLPPGWIITGAILKPERLRDEKVMGKIGRAAYVSISKKVCRDDENKG